MEILIICGSGILASLIFFLCSWSSPKRTKANWMKIHGQREWESKRRRMANDIYLYKY